MAGLSQYVAFFLLYCWVLKILNEFVPFWKGKFTVGESRGNVGKVCICVDVGPVWACKDIPKYPPDKIRIVCFSLEMTFGSVHVVNV